MGYDEISGEGRKARFEQWEKYGADRLKSDLQTDPYRRVGARPVQDLAWEFVRMKEAELVATAASVMRQAAAKEAELVAAAASVIRQASSVSPSIGSVASASLPATPPVSVASRSNAQSGEILTLKPGVWGMSVDLKEAARRLRKRLKKS